MRRWGRVVAGGLLLLALLSLGLWLQSAWRMPRPLSLDLPIAPARRVHVNVWKPVKDNTSFIFNGMLAHEIDRPLTVVLWLHHTRPASAIRLASIRLPTWPLLVIAGALGAGGSWLWRRTTGQHCVANPPAVVG
jgi:hypothetical protein